MADSQRLQETIGKDCKALCKCRVFTNGGREGALIRGVGLHKCPSSCPLPRVGQGQRLPPHLLQPRVSRGGSPPGCSQGQLPRGGNMGGGLEGCLKWTRQGRVLGRGISLCEVWGCGSIGEGSQERESEVGVQRHEVGEDGRACMVGALEGQTRSWGKSVVTSSKT